MVIVNLLGSWPLTVQLREDHRGLNSLGDAIVVPIIRPLTESYDN